MGNNWDKTIKRVSTDEYVAQKAVPEVRQLLSEYGPIGIFWWDTPRKMSQESFDALHSLTRLQPSVITNDRLGEAYPGDYKTFERNIPDRGPEGKDWEVCMPISGSWGYKKGDNSFKSSEKLIRNLVDIASKGGNYLLNVSPTGQGTLLPPAIERLEAIGDWMDVNGESIYDTQQSPFVSLSWGRCTRRESDDSTKLYLHVFDWPEDGKLLVPGLSNDVQDSYLLANRKALTTEKSDDGMLISLPSDAPDDIASVVVLNVTGKLEVKVQLPTVDKDGKIVLTADQAFVHNNEGSPQAGLRAHDDIPHIGYWIDRQAFVEWTFRALEPGDYEARVVLSVENEKTRFGYGVVGDAKFAEVPSTGSYGIYVEKVLGTIKIKEAGECTVRIKPDAEAWEPMNLRQLELRRQ